MLKILVVIPLLFLQMDSGQAITDEVTLHVKAEGVRNSRGMCYLLLFKNKKGFPDSSHHAEAVLRKPVEGNSVDFRMVTRAGKYAISILHDENLNEKMDKTWYGKPVEGFGVSNNPPVGAGPPDFSESAPVSYT
ncbi:MAG: DUF2141 domain-containing protein, partial [Methanosarcina sp.]|nr:DUF2141 domain-containing protein [Methanosarcina sp.]